MARNMLAWGTRFIADRLKTHAGETIDYSRGTCSCHGLTATRGQTEFQTEDDSGFVITAHSVDWIFAAADLVIDGAVVLPDLRDFITDAAGKIYQVLVIPGGTHYRFSDPQQTRLRVHTRLSFRAD